MSLPEPGREPFLSSADGIAGRLRATPEDFAVAERELLPPEATDGRHTIVRVTARNRETNLLVRDLARRLASSRVPSALPAPRTSAPSRRS